MKYKDFMAFAATHILAQRLRDKSLDDVVTTVKNKQRQTMAMCTEATENEIAAAVETADELALKLSEKFDELPEDIPLKMSKYEEFFDEYELP